MAWLAEPRRQDPKFHSRSPDFSAQNRVRSENSHASKPNNGFEEWIS
jgi:hypothetical protein